MSAKSKPDEAARYDTVLHAQQQAKGLRLVQFWLPDVDSEEFKREAHRQSLVVANSPSEADDQAFIDSVASIWQERD